MRAALAAVLVGLLASAAAAQADGRWAADRCVLPVTDRSVPAAPRRALSAAPTCDPGSEGARFDVTYDGFPAGAEAAFQAAVDTWSCLIRSDHVIRVSASWEPLAPSTLGSAGPFLYRNFDGAPTRDVWFPAALADALAGRDLDGDQPDIEAFFNSDFDDWHVGSGPPGRGEYDLYTVVLHELGHGLGLIGSMTVEDGVGQVGDEPDGPFSYDLHTRTAGGASLLDADLFPDGSARLADALQAEVVFAGRAVEQAVGTPVPLYAPAQWVQGGSYSHLDEDRFGAGTPDGLMTPFIARGETIPSPGTAICGMVADVGWTLAGDCAARVGELPVANPAVTLTPMGPNPFGRQTRVRVSSDVPTSVRLALYDVLGRRVEDYGTAILAGGRAIDLTVDAERLASGVYFVSARGGAEPALLPLTVAR